MDATDTEPAVLPALPLQGRDPEDARIQGHTDAPGEEEKEMTSYMDIPKHEEINRLVVVTAFLVTIAILGMIVIAQPAGAIMFPENMKNHPLPEKADGAIKDAGLDVKPIKPITIEPTIIPEPVITVEEKAESTYKPSRVLSKDILEAIQQIIGIKPTSEEIVVTVDDAPVAILPPDSPLIDREITRKCLRYGFATENWKICEWRLGKYGDYTFVGTPQDINPNLVEQ